MSAPDAHGARVRSVHVGRPKTYTWLGRELVSSIFKDPVSGPVAVRADHLEGDEQSDRKSHGGADKAVYAYAREDLDVWQHELERDLDNGMFGENLTTVGVDVAGARIGERWQVGSDGLVLEVSRPRVPCRTFAAWLEIQGWVKTFTKAATPGAYLRVIASGTVRGGDSIVVLDRPNHEVTIDLVFRALTLEPELLPRVLEADALPDEIKEQARRRVVS